MKNTLNVLIKIIGLLTPDKAHVLIWSIASCLMIYILKNNSDYYLSQQVITLLLSNQSIWVKLLLCTVLMCFALFFSLLRVVYKNKKSDKYIDIKKIKLDKTSALILQYLYNEKDGKYLDNIINFSKLNTGDTRYNLDVLKKYNLINSSMLSGPDGPYYISEHGRKYVAEIINKKL